MGATINKNISEQDRMEKLLNGVTIGAAIACAILVVELLGIIVMKIFMFEIHGFFYNFIFGLGVLALFALILSIIQEITEK